MTTHRLVLLRHAKAEHGLDVPDHDRPLTLRGRRQSAEVGTAMACAAYESECVLSDDLSPAYAAIRLVKRIGEISPERT